MFTTEPNVKKDLLKETKENSLSVVLFVLLLMSQTSKNTDVFL